MQNLEQLAAYMTDNALKLATAESCTGGLIAAKVAGIQGSGAWLSVGFVVYQPEAKMDFLDVNAETIERCKLTSEEVAREMAIGALKTGHGNIAVANTGVAGPGPAPDGTPPGTVCFAWAFRQVGDDSVDSAQSGDSEVAVYSETQHFERMDRNGVREAAADHTLFSIPDYHQRYVRGDMPHDQA
jgi:nicotinamide-nucleotide amidase